MGRFTHRPRFDRTRRGEGIIHTVNVAIQRIVEVTQIMGEQIGTKGFTK